ncbi:HpcH/HpaI aldolase/citrate lyase family protein [Frankia sp. CNm7]|uniref:HpcH/HpaI aldolase/citrate lyase family protein n=1 Tax=Frankia nepalensis TaxID=1836974 RepID=A0A937US61_9ACTN|nr:HpcH/HpaI aldolase/citrate lyase family protein [Frankia nepalensis]MBL7499842.1 HpcH/HpaI aldolase/citrate lyase family protein [Frankia nepalensis]MBL7516490.1 HpcH/HpaI aldolase/citrate lyase family protein [Frankia nepalensis]MBL7520048.1 HpcH/HpaI aldolase/citrate lyase family protein [Frankia nepalensis]MBL7628546.1 HpcH/HpaI aldolase/citrate lyase family protein [Frankia nepalensis]
MRHFAFLDAAATDALFHCPPQEISAADERRLVATALGATLYAPGTRPRLADDVRRQLAAGVASMVLCLEDAIADHEVPAAEANVVLALNELGDSPPAAGESPGLLFVRVRAAEQIPALVAGLTPAAAALLAGFVLPKFVEDTGEVALDAVLRAGDDLGRPLWAMPVLESPEVINRESRLETLLGVRRLLDKHAEHVLAVRLGATDLSGLFGLRRDRDLTIYDIAVVRDCIADIVNVCARGGEHVVTGPVWEYFAQPERLFVSSLRVTPFANVELVDPVVQGQALRRDLVSADLDRLIKEVVLDKANGLIGKTVIHPSHVAAVHALYVVTHEEYEDAQTVLAGEAGGVRPSRYANKMNELRPHRLWAQAVVRRATAFGVLREGHTFVDVLAASQAVTA